jgi:nucleotide-binding universal stress UspA family protein
LFSKILLAYDGTKPSDLAFERALEIVKRFHAPIHIVAVAWSAEVETHFSIDKARVQCWEYLKPLRDRGAAAQVDLELEVVEGNPSEQIVAVADRFGADLLSSGIAGASCRVDSLRRRSQSASSIMRIAA